MSKDFDVSRSFYDALDFTQTVINGNLSLYERDGVSFYLQRYYVKEWLENTMLFVVVDDVHQFFQHLQELKLDQIYPSVKVLPIQKEEWGEVGLFQLYSESPLVACTQRFPYHHFHT
ncbi:glyoxalase [Parapedobacter tibetensis]|uniref:glyoxalase n=1 Tax=Parapedobacter tibetensis TaxID=2972951 RepID=UPI00214D1FCE|nr:glyoxalase [Parapedobacter tibetensis]